MSEARMWEAIRPVLRPVDPVRIESHMAAGVPDVNYTEGWIELKYAARWPPRGGPLRLDHFTTAQRSWLRRREAAGGRAFLLLKVGKTEWILMTGVAAAAYLGQSTQEEIYNNNVARWTRLPKSEEIIRWLTK